MSFFGFDTTLPKDRQRTTGFGQAGDAFAGFSGGNETAAGQTLDFDDTYDGLGDQLPDEDDALNDDTFGGGGGGGGGGYAAQGKVGRDFDFSGNTAKMATTLQEEQMLYDARQPPPKAPAQQPARSGYERYAESDYIPKLEANASLWSTAPRPPPTDAALHQRQQSQAPPGLMNRKMMSLEEVEASMRAQKRPTPQPAHSPFGMPPQQQPTPPNFPQMQSPFVQQPPPGMQPHQMFGAPPQILQRPPQAQAAQGPPSAPRQVQPDIPVGPSHAPIPTHPQILQRQRPAHVEQVARVQHHGQGSQSPQGPMGGDRGAPQQPRHILQNPNRLSGPGQPLTQPMHAQRPSDFSRQSPMGASHSRGPSYPGQVITHPEQLLNLSDEDKAAFLAEDARRAKRNHKIHLLSRDNGLMTPQDKNFITRIQLQQLVTATGGVDEQGPESMLNEDFYYQVYSQIRGAPRQTPNQPANQFAQTYLFQTGGRYGPSGRRHPRGGDNHMQRMEQQVQRAVEAAKAKPKNKQLVIEGSLGKISFSNSKTPKPLLNIKRADSGDVRPASGREANKTRDATADKRRELRRIESVYTTLLRLEEQERHLPPPLDDISPPEVIQGHMEFQAKIQELNKNLWQDLQVMEPINQNSATTHPFIAILNHAKGKKLIPRLFRHLDEQQRLTVVTILVIHLDTLDVVAHAVPAGNDPLAPLPQNVREEIDLFAHTIMPSIFSLVNDASLNIIAGIVGLILDRAPLGLIIRTRIGLSLLTMLISRAELLKQSTPDISIQQWDDWSQLYNRLFDAIEARLPTIFTTSVNDTEDVYVWQFLAAMGVGASPDQQQRLVIGVKDRVMETVNVGRSLPKDLSSVRLGHVNLFMRAIGLDVELLG